MTPGVKPGFAPVCFPASAGVPPPQTPSSLHGQGMAFPQSEAHLLPLPVARRRGVPPRSRAMVCRWQHGSALSSLSPPGGPDGVAVTPGMRQNHPGEAVCAAWSAKLINV